MKFLIRISIIAVAAFVGFAFNATAGVVPIVSASGHNGGNGWDNGDLSDAYSTSGINTSTDPDDPSTWVTTGSGWTEGWGASTQLDPGAAANGKIGWITFDLGSTVADLDKMYIWNRRDNGQDEGVDSYNLYYATAPTVPVPAPVAAGTEYGDYDFASGGWTLHSSGNLTVRNPSVGNGAEDVLSLGGISARYVAIEILSSINPDTRVGLDEVAITENAVTMHVVASSPADGQLISSTPTTATFDFSLDVTPGTVQAADLLVDGNPTATGISIVDADTVAFDLPGGLAAGGHTLELPASAMTGGPALTPLSEFSSTFTLVIPPTIDNLAPTGVVSDAAIIGADLVATGGNLPDVLVYWGDNDGGTNVGSWDHVIDLGPSSIGSYPRQLSSLTSETQYFYRSLASNAAGDTWAASTASFTTPETPPTTAPAIINLPATGLGANSAQLRGQVTDTGGETPIVTLYYGDEDAGAGTWDNSVVVGPQSGSFSELVSGLLPLTTYYYRSEATNSAGTAVATPALSFTTPAVTPVSIVVNEVHFDPDIKTELVEFIELYNAGVEAVDVSGWTIEDAVEYTIPADTTIASGAYLVISQNPGHMVAKFGVSSIGPYDRRLNTDGETIVLRDDLGQKQDSVDYRLGFPWPTVGDAPGNSIELINPALSNSKGGNWRSSDGAPTPGESNSVYAVNAAPVMRQVDHSPSSPGTGEVVTITVKVTDPDGVAQVYLSYQHVEPGDYIEISDSRYATQWTHLAMVDDGTNGDDTPGDDTYTVILPASLQQHRHLIRYRITSEDSLGTVITGPYADDPTPNFAYYVYNGVPDWVSTQPKLYSGAQLSKPAVYQLITTRADHEDAMYIPNTSLTEGYMGSEYLWQGAFVYDGNVYDHINYRTRGGVHRYRWSKRMWKFDFNRGHYFQARDDYGKKYKKTWDKVNFSSLANQWGQPGQQGLFEQVGFKLFNLSGNFAPNTTMAHFRIVESADENSNQVGSGPNYTDFQGLYLVIEQPDGRLLDEHGQPDGNLYKMEAGTGELNNQGPTQPDDKSDLNTFLQYKSGTKTAQWWKDNLDLDDYYSYRSIATAIHHYDTGAGKNYFFFNNPEAAIWQIMSWDLDITWQNPGDTSQPGPFTSYVLAFPEFAQDYRNRMREVRDLLFNREQVGMMLDETASFIDTPGVNSIAEADGVMWRGNGTTADTFPGKVAYTKQYVIDRCATIDASILTDSALVPQTPAVTYTGGTNYPANDLTFERGPYSGVSAFAAIEWRIGEITDTNSPSYDPTKRRVYEVEHLWESGDITNGNVTTVTVPNVVEVDHTYRVRCRMKDVAGRWSHWSAPVEFSAGPPDDLVTLRETLRVSEVMYNPPEGSDYEFIELFNSGTNPLDIADVALADGIDFTFAGSSATSLAANATVLVVRDLAAFSTRYDTNGMTIAGEYTRKLGDGGEEIEILGAGEAEIVTFDYNDARGWPLSADGAGHSLVPLVMDGQESGVLDYGGNWRASAFIGGSPGVADPDPIVDVVINEFAAHTDTGLAPPEDSDDWIELYSVSNMTLAAWYLSDDVDNLKQWRIPPGSVITPGGWLTFYESTGFHSNRVDGFGLNKAGERIFLSYLPGTDQDRVADCIRFEGQENGASWGRYTDGAAFWHPTVTTPTASNRLAAVEPVISQIMYHPAAVGTNASDDTELEYLVIQNDAASAVELWNAVGPWRVRGISYTLPSNTVIGAGESLTLVAFDPGDAVAVSNFLAAHNLSGTPPVLLGPPQRKAVQLRRTSRARTPAGA